MISDVTRISAYLSTANKSCSFDISIDCQSGFFQTKSNQLRKNISFIANF